MAIIDVAIKEELRKNPYAFFPVGAHTANSTLNSAVTVTIPAGSNGLLVQAFTQNIRFTIDGTTPTSTTGFRLTAGSDPVVLTAVTDNAVFKFIEEAASATLQYQAIRIGACE